MDTISRSSNCKSYTDSISVYVKGTVAVKGKEDRCKVDVSAFSCQRGTLEQPDKVTSDELVSVGSEKLRGLPDCEGEYVLESTTNVMGARAVDYSPEQLIQLGMASNCFSEGNDPNMTSHMAYATCNPMEAMIDSTGTLVKNTNMKFRSNLAVCDISDKAMPQVQEDLRKVAAYNAAEHGLKVQRPEDLACSIAVLPYV